jgi:hypothetical protein
MFRKPTALVRSALADPLSVPAHSLLEPLEPRKLLSGSYGGAFRIGSDDSRGGFDDEQERGGAIVADADGNTYLAIDFRGTADVDPRPGNTLSVTSAVERATAIVKYDANRIPLWAMVIDAQADDESEGLAVDADGNVFFAGRFRGTADLNPGPNVQTELSSDDGDRRAAFVIKLDSSGGFQWAKVFRGTRSVEAHSLTTTPDGGVVLTGRFEGTADFDPGTGTANRTSLAELEVGPPDDTEDGNGFVVKLDAAGAFQWVTVMTGLGFAMPLDVASGPDGQIAVGGVFQGTIDFDASGPTASFTSNNGSMDGFVMLLGSDGLLTWVKQLGGSQGELTATGPTEGVLTVAIGPDGQVIAGGLFLGTVDFDPGTLVVNLVSAGGAGKSDGFVAKLGDDGALGWARKYGGAGTESVTALSVDQQGAVYFGGDFSSSMDVDPGAATATLTSAGRDDIFVGRVDDNGTHRWGRRIGGTGEDSLRDLTVDDNGRVVSTGAFTGTVDFDPGAGSAPLTASAPAGAAGTDIFVATLLQEGQGIITASIAGVELSAAETPASAPVAVGLVRFGRLGPAGAALRMNFTIGGTATLGADYLLRVDGVNLPASQRFVQFAPGQTAVDVEVVPIDDLAVENPETVILTLAASTQYGLPALPERSVTVSLTDNEPRLSIVTLDSTAAETSALQQPSGGQFLLIRTGNASPITVNLPRSGTATYGVDYRLEIGGVPLPASQRTVTLGQGQTELAISLVVLNDAAVENTESVVLTVGSGTGYGLSAVATQRTATVNIADNESTVAISLLASAVAAESGAPSVFGIGRNGDTDYPLTVQLSRGGRATFGGSQSDYTLLADGTPLPANLRLTIPAGQSNVAVTMQATQDSRVEGDEDVIIGIVNQPAYRLPTTRSLTLGITDDEPVVFIDDAGITSISEAGATSAQAIALVRQGDLSQPLKVDFTLSGTATAGSDYVSWGFNSVTFPANQSTLFLPLSTLRDNRAEPTETLIFTLRSNATYSLATNPAAQRTTINITDGAAGTGVDLAIASVSGPIRSFSLARNDAPVTITSVIRNTGPVLFNGPLTATLLLSQNADGSEAVPLGEAIPFPNRTIAGNGSVTLSITFDPDDLDFTQTGTWYTILRVTANGQDLQWISLLANVTTVA